MQCFCTGPPLARSKGSQSLKPVENLTKANGKSRTTISDRRSGDLGRPMYALLQGGVTVDPGNSSGRRILNRFWLCADFALLCLEGRKFNKWYPDSVVNRAKSYIERELRATAEGGGRCGRRSVRIAVAVEQSMEGKVRQSCRYSTVQ